MEKMMKRVITALIGFPIVVAVLAFANKYVVDVILAIVALIGMNEYIKCVEHKDIHVIKWVSYLSVLGIAFIHVIPAVMYINFLLFSVPVLLMILFFHVIVTNMKITFQDAAYTLFGIAYIYSFLVFLAIIFGIEGNISGKLLIWYVFCSAWGTDTCAYLIGMKFGKHKFSKVSPKKSIEGCVAGVVGAIILCFIYTFAINSIFNLEISYVWVAIMSAVLSVIGQIGDFSASVIKRFFEVKDYSNLFPGHGGMLDRIDSAMFIAPFAYMLILIIL